MDNLLPVTNPNIRLIQCVWEMFERSDVKEVAKCKICNRVISTPGGSTTGPHKHLESKHGTRATKLKRNAAGSVTSIQHQVSTFAILESNSLEAILSRLIALDGIPISKIRTSTDLRRGIEATLQLMKCPQVLPYSDAAIKAIVVNFADKGVSLLRQVLQQFQKDGKWLSIDLDEWRTRNNKRYINVSVLSDRKLYWNLGLIPLTGSATATRILEFIGVRLGDFGLELEKSIILAKIASRDSSERMLAYRSNFVVAVLIRKHEN